MTTLPVPEQPIRVLVVEDSPVVREMLVRALDVSCDLSVVGTAVNGEEAIEAALRVKPDIITMDIHMPGMNGIEATRHIMETHPVPIIVLSGSIDPGDASMIFETLNAGAVAFIAPPAGLGHPEHEEGVRKLVQMVRLMSEVKVVRRWPKQKQASLRRMPDRAVTLPAKISLVALGASTGGPIVLQSLLSSLPRDFPLPVLVVQHMSSGFLPGFVEWLSHTSAMPVRLAVDAETLLPSRVYVAPDGFQMKVVRGGKIALVRDVTQKDGCPSVSFLFRSLVEVYGKTVVAGLLTGMGRDGAAELKLLRENGAITFAQDKESAVVHGMPGEAIRLGGAAFVLNPEEMVTFLVELAINKTLRKT